MTFVAGTVLTAAALNTELASKTDLAMVQNAQTGTTYSFALADASKLLTTSNASAVSVTVTKQATVTWVTGTQLRIMNLGAGVTTLVADTGVTINGNVALKQYQGGQLIRTASDVWLFVPTASASSSGMDLITPTSVAGAGVTLSGGEVSFSAATTISINGCFTAAYDNYLVQARYVAAAGIPSVSLRMRNAGVNASGAGTYFTQRLTSATASVVSTQVTDSQTRICDASTSQNVSITEFFGPALAVTTTGKNRGTIISTTSGIQMNFHDFGHNVATAHDGFSFYPSTSSLTGTLRVYGLRNS